MPSFTFTLADGRKGTVNAPEGTTQEQAYGYLQQQMQSQQQQTQPQEPAPTPEKPAPIKSTDVIEHMRQKDPLNRPPGSLAERAPRTSLGEAAGAIGTSSALGAALGAISPEIVKTLGVASLAIPVVGEAVGPALIGAGTAMQAGRLAATGLGALSGAGSEAAGQAVQAVGGTRGQAEAARLVAGGITPSAAAVAGFVSKPLGLAWKMAQRFAGVEASTPKAVEAAREALAKSSEAGQPQTALHAMLQKGVEADRQAADKAAAEHIANAHAEAARLARTDAEAANRLVEDARTRADTIRADAAKRAGVLEKASDGKLATANRVLAQAQPELEKVGQSRELSDIGTDLRGAATAQEQAQVASRKASYDKTVAERDATVAAREASGESVDTTPGMQALKKDLETKLGTDAKGFVRTTDQGVRRGYQQVYDAINRREVITGMNADGTPIKQTFKTSFEALDHVRRRLGDVVAGQDVEGYAAIGKQAARKMYSQISKIQEEFVGTSGGTPLKANFEPSQKWLEKQVSVGKNTVASQSLNGYTELKTLPNGLKIVKEPGYQGAISVFQHDPNGYLPWKKVGRVTYKEGGRIENFAVSPEFQRQGLGGEMLKSGEEAGILNPKLDPEDLSTAGAAALNKYRGVGRNPQKILQTEYADATKGLEEFGSKTGKKLTAMDRLGLEHVTDPKELPKRIFSSQQSVRDARGLIKNDALLDKQASDYASRSMQGMSAKQAQKWARENADWMREIPGLQKRVTDYANKLDQIERVAGKLETRAGAAKVEAGAVRKEAATAAEKERQAGIERAGKAAEGSQAAQERVRETGRQRAEDIRKERYAPTKGLETILKGGESPEAVRNLLLNGKPEQTRLAAQHLAVQPGGKTVLEQSVRQTMRNMTQGNLQQQWTERILPMLRDGEMIEPERLAALERDVNRLLASYKGPDKLSLVQRHIAAALGAAPSVAMGRK